MSDDLELALSLADLADSITLPRFRAPDLKVTTKPDLTPVTEVDRAVEVALREQIGTARPDHGVLGEEMGDQSAGRSSRWVVDPLDGTKNYVRGIPVWATLIALETGSNITVGVVSAPALGRRWWASRGQGAWAGDTRLRVSAVTSLGDAQLSYDEIAGFDGAGITSNFLALARSCWRTRAFGDFWSHMLVAEGAVDIAVEPEVAYWDMAAVQVIVEEAGGTFSALDGHARADRGSGVSTNGLLHGQVLAALATGAGAGATGHDPSGR